MGAYEEIKRRIVGLGRAESASQLDTLDASVAGVASKFIATTITYPSQVLRSRLQQNTMGSRAGMYQGTLNALHQTLQFTAYEEIKHSPGASLLSHHIRGL